MVRETQKKQADNAQPKFCDIGTGPELQTSSIESKTSCRPESSCHGSSLNVADLAAFVTCTSLLSLGLSTKAGERCDLPLAKANTCTLGFPVRHTMEPLMYLNWWLKHVL